MKTVIHHSADYDGIFCMEIAKLFLPNAKIIGWDFGHPKVDYPVEGEVYLLDLPPDCLSRFPDRRLTWIDHHKSSIEKWENEKTENNIAGYRIDGVAASRLTWQWFTVDQSKSDLPAKRQYLDRKVDESLALTLVGEYDVWQHENSKGDDITFQFGLDCEIGLDWRELLAVGHTGYALKLLERGRAAQQCYRKRDAEIVLQRGFDVKFEGLNFIALNTAHCNSQSFEAAVLPEHDGCLAFYWNGKVFIVSLYGVPHKPDIDLSIIAVNHGGGGHKQACGFQVSSLPWIDGR